MPPFIYVHEIEKIQISDRYLLCLVIICHCINYNALIPTIVILYPAYLATYTWTLIQISKTNKVTEMSFVCKEVI